MTLRERIADWISGGAVQGERAASMDRMYLGIDVAAYRLALRDIVDMETPGANATVRRMAARAREALR